MKKTTWIRSMRKKQGLKGFQLAQRMQVSAARISVLEKDEGRGAVTLNMMSRVAAAMDCRFEYRIVPLRSETDSVSIASKPRVRVV